MKAQDDGWDWVVTVEDAGNSKYVCDDSAFRRSLGTRLSILRTDAGMSPQDIEDFLGIKKADLLGIEAGLLEIDEQMAEQFAMAYGVTVAELRK